MTVRAAVVEHVDQLGELDAHGQTLVALSLAMAGAIDRRAEPGVRECEELLRGYLVELGGFVPSPVVDELRRARQERIAQRGWQQ